MQIVLNNVTFAYKKDSEILHDISLCIDEGECIGVMGKTGSGKTTLLELIAGLLKPTNGTITTPKNDIGFVFQNPEQQLFAATVREDVGFGLKFSGLSKQEKETRVEKALTLM